MANLIVYDCEFLTAEGAQSRYWCGPHDPDPVIAQIGAVKIDLDDGFAITEQLKLHVIPRGRDGSACTLDPLFTRLTGITDQIIADEGKELDVALRELDAFSEGATLWSWGKDEFNMIAISCYVAGLPPPLPIGRFGNACDLLLKAGMPYDDLKVTRSNTLSAYYKLEHPPLRGHDALDDALSVAYVLQYLLRDGKLTAQDVANPQAV